MTISVWDIEKMILHELNIFLQPDMIRAV